MCSFPRIARFELSFAGFVAFLSFASLFIVCIYTICSIPRALFARCHRVMNQVCTSRGSPWLTGRCLNSRFVSVFTYKWVSGFIFIVSCFQSSAFSSALEFLFSLSPCLIRSPNPLVIHFGIEYILFVFFGFLVSLLLIRLLFNLFCQGLPST